MQLKGNSFI